MVEKINEQVSVVTVYNEAKGSVLPWLIHWKGRKYVITTVAYHHKVKNGRYVYHIFSVCNESIFFKLRLDTETLHWWLEEVSDGLAY